MTNKKQKTAKKFATITGVEDGFLVCPLVNIWDTPERNKVVAKFKHGTQVEILRREIDVSNKTDAFLIKNRRWILPVKGYVTGTFLALVYTEIE